MGQSRIGHDHYGSTLQLLKQVTKWSRFPKLYGGNEHGEEHHEAMTIEMQALQQVVTWDVMPRCQVPGHQCSTLTWAYKLKCYPDGCPRKSKAWLCIREDKQSKQIDYTDKYWSIWTTIWMQMNLMIWKLEVAYKNGWSFPSQVEGNHLCGVTQVVWVTRWFWCGSQVNKSLYGLVQAPLCLYSHLREGLLLRLCTLWPRPMSVIWSWNGTVISLDKMPRRLMQLLQDQRRSLISQLKTPRMVITDVFAYLGVEVKVDKKQGYQWDDLSADRIDWQGVESYWNEGLQCQTYPACTTPLGTNADEQRCQLWWDYALMIGTLMYLTSYIGQTSICCTSM